MKKNVNEDNNSSKHKRPSFFTRKNDIKKFENHEEGIRHIENATSFLNEFTEPTGEYGTTEDLHDKWGLSNSDAKVHTGFFRKGFVSAAIAIAVIIMVIVMVFVVLPKVLPSFFKNSNIELFIQKSVTLEYDDMTRVVTDCSANVMTMPDVTSERVTEVLLNEPVTLLSTNSGNGYDQIRTADGIVGYVLDSQLTDETESVEPDLHEYKLVVSDTSKNVMTHANNGTLITKVMMNTVLYADVKRDGVYQVELPGGDMGWIGSSGVIELGTRDTIGEVSCRYFVSSALSEVNATYIENGLTISGMSINGLVYVCSTVNGIPMPRTMQEQSQAGQEVTLSYDAVTGQLDLDSIIPGDIVFLSSPYDSDGTIYEMGICTDVGTLLMVSDARTTIKLVNFDSSDELCNRIVTVRRIFAS